MLELYIDDLHYISYPTSCTEEISISSESSSAYVITMFNVVVATVRQSAWHKISKSFDNILPSNLVDSDPVASAMGLSRHAKAPDPCIIRRSDIYASVNVFMQVFKK